MLSGWLLALSVAASPGQCATCGPVGGGGMEFSPGMASGSFVAGAGGFSNPYDAISSGGGGGGDQLYPFDSPEPWLHGYFQELPAHSGYASFRPHNYKHVLSQMELAGRWGMNPVMGYSHQWYHRYRQRSGMHPNFGSAAANLEQPSFGHVSQSQNAGSWSDQSSTGQLAPANAQENSLQQAAALQLGYTGTAIPGITTPYYQRAAQQPAAPVETVSAEYLARMDKLQKQLEEQTFQMQLMQQQMQDKSQLPEWQQPNHIKFQNNNQAQEPRQLQQFSAAPAQGYQELQPPAAFQQPAYGQQAQPAQISQGYPQAQPAYQQVPQYQNVPAQVPPQGYGAQPGYQSQGQGNATQPPPILTAPPQGPAMRIPQGQAYFSSPQNSAPAYAAAPQRQPAAETHAVWQQNTNQATAPAYGGQYEAVAPQQQQYQQLQYAQPEAYQPSQYQQPQYQQPQYQQPQYAQPEAYQQAPAGQGQYYQ